MCMHAHSNYVCTEWYMDSIPSLISTHSLFSTRTFAIAPISIGAKVYGIPQCHKWLCSIDYHGWYFSNFLFLLRCLMLNYTLSKAMQCVASHASMFVRTHWNAKRLGSYPCIPLYFAYESDHKYFSHWNYLKVSFSPVKCTHDVSDVHYTNALYLWLFNAQCVCVCVWKIEFTRHPTLPLSQFRMYTMLSLHEDGRSWCKITHRTQFWRLEVLEMYRSRDISVFIMYYIHVMCGPSLLIQSTDSMIVCITYPGVNTLAATHVILHMLYAPSYVHIPSCTHLSKCIHSSHWTRYHTLSSFQYTSDSLKSWEEEHAWVWR